MVCEQKTWLGLQKKKQRIGDSKEEKKDRHLTQTGEERAR